MTKFDINLPTLTMMVGLAGSGKSTWAKQLLGNNQSIESSDEWRVKLYGDINDQSHNNEVFQAMQKSTVDKLKRGESVIYDATNVKIKDRKKILDLVKNIDCHKMCYIIATPIEECISQDASRERSVGEHVIKRQMHNFQIPFYAEGWDAIDVLNRKNIITYQELIESMLGFDQQNKHHDFDLFTHCIESGRALLERTGIYYDGYREDLLIAMSLHDISKIHTQTFGEDGQAHYFNHANVGAYYVLSNANFSQLDSFCHTMLPSICFYINYHMLPYDWKTEKIKDKWKKIFGEPMFDDLMLIHECDDNSQKRKEY